MRERHNDDSKRMRADAETTAPFQATEGSPAQPNAPVLSSEKLRIFISYSRDDIDFADQLFDALAVTGFDPTMDRLDIGGGEEWRARLRNLIRAADTVLFVLSPSSAISDMCVWEVDEAAKFNKRFVPVLCRPLKDAVPPELLKDLDYIYFYPDPKLPRTGFGTGLRRLVSSLNTDLDWLREHTRLLTRATEWECAGRVENRMLSGDQITAAKEWAARRPKGAPEPTGLHLDYIRASEDAEELRQNLERQSLAEREALVRQNESAHRERLLALRKARYSQEQLAKAVDTFSWILAGLLTMVSVLYVAVAPSANISAAISIVVWGGYTIISGFVAWQIARLKRRNHILWALWAFLFPPTLLVLCIVPILQPNSD